VRRGPSVAAIPIIGGLALLAVVVRLWGLTQHGVWFDEAYYAQVAALPAPVDIISAVLAVPPSAPLYALLLNGWVGITGTGDAAIRLPSVVFGTALAPATLWLGRELTGRSSVGLLARRSWPSPRCWSS